MGGRGSASLRNGKAAENSNDMPLNIPNKYKFYSWSGGWMLVDGEKERFEEGWDSGINITKVSRVSTTHASGRGHSSTEYKISNKGKPIIDHTFGSLQEAKEYILKQSRRKK